MNPEIAARFSAHLDRLQWHMDVMFVAVILATGLVGVLLIRSWRS